MEGKKALKADWAIDTKLESTSYHDDELKKLLDKDAEEPKRKDGDLAKAFSEADQIIERIYESPFLPHNCLEPMNFYADVTEERVEMLGPIQTPAWARSRVAAILEREESEINVHMTRMGGGFGRRLYGDFSDEAAEISSLAKSPIQLVFSREDDMTAGTYRPAIKYKIQASLKDNNITGYKLTEAAINSGMYGLIPHFFPAGAIANYEVHSHALKSNITTGAWRAPYTNFLAFAEQSFFDELADLIGKDAVQLRLDLLEGAKSVAEEDENIQYSPGRMQEVIKLAAEKSGWDDASPEVFMGFSAYYSHNTHVAEVAHVTMVDGVPSIKKVTCAVDCGIVVNPDAAINQIEGGIVDGIGHAMYGDLSFEDGRPSASNFDKFRLIKLSEAPQIDVHFVDNGLSPTGLGEPSLPPAGGAVANALYKATGQRIYAQPFIKPDNVLG